MNCEYCGAKNQGGEYCEKCSAKIPEKKDIWKSDPFFYEGYICYAITDYCKRTREIQFWLGRELIQRICLPFEFIDTRIIEAEDPMPLFWDLFLLAQGEKDVIEWQEKNKKYPMRFEVRRIENETVEAWKRGEYIDTLMLR